MIRLAYPLALALSLMAAAPSVGATPDDADLSRKLRQAITGSVRGRLVSAEALTRAQGRSDLSLAREASTAITRELGSRVKGLVVSAAEGVIELRGEVRDPVSAQRALQLAAAIPGAHGVRSSLDGAQMLATREDPTAPFSFATDTLLGGRGLSLQVERGMVHLSGEVNGREARRFVVAAVRGVRGVRGVVDGLVEREVPVDSDVGLLALLDSLLRTSPDLQHLADELVLSVRSGVVHVSGVVDQEWERDLLELSLLSSRLVLVVVSDVELSGGEGLAPRSAR
jgi:osmotically-inducible protein OsmY